MRIPDELSKYFKGQNSISQSSSTDEINNYLKERLEFGKKTDVGSVRIRNSENPYFFNITHKTLPQAFADSCWKNLKQQEKMRTIYLLVKHLCSKLRIKYMPQIRLIGDEKNKVCFGEAEFNEGDKNTSPYIYIKPSSLDLNGIELANIIAHELQHAYDFNAVLETINEVQEKYLPPCTNYIANETFINIPLTGNIKNKQTGMYDTITPDIREQIILSKNRIAPIKPTTSKINNLEDITNEQEMFYFLEYFAYIFSPLELHAYKHGANIAKSFIENNEFNFISSTNDTQIHNNITEFFRNYHEQIQNIEQLTGLEMYQIFDLFTKRSFYMQRDNKRYKEQVDLINEHIKSIASKAFSNMPEHTI